MKLHKSFVMAVAAALMVSLAGPVERVDAATNIQCQGGPAHFSSFAKQGPANNQLNAVRAKLDKQGAPLCLNPGAAPAPSASSWWIMIIQGAAANNDYIQYGFWNCQTWCNFGWPGGGTQGQTHEFYERNNGNLNGVWRVDLGNPGAGQYTLAMQRVIGPNVWKFYRNDVLRAEHSDSFRDWSLFGAKYSIASETWDKGDQNGGSNFNRVHMKSASWGLDLNAYANVGMDACFHAPNNPNGWYGCSRYTTTVANDSISTWTNDR